MQNINPPTVAQLLAEDQQPLLKLEIFVGAAWIDITNLAGKNYLKSISTSQGGAGMTPEPVAGSWTAVINNENNIFHPDHPDSIYTEYFRIGRQAKLSLGGIYGGTDREWERIIGYMQEPRFSIDNTEVELHGFDYMQLLSDTELKKPDNYWGADVTKSTIASEETLDVEMYDEDDAMEIIADANNVTPWDVPYDAAIVSVAPGGAPSTNVGRVIKDAAAGINFGYVEDNNVGTVEQGKEYKVVFQYLVSAGVLDEFSVGIYKTATTWQATHAYVVGDTVEPTIGNTNNCFYECTVAGNSAGAEPAWPTVENGGIVDGTVTWATRYMNRKKMGEITGLTAAAWTEETFYFTATESCAIKMRLTVTGAGRVATTAYIDVISIKEVTGTSNAGYNLPDVCNEPYYVTLDGEPIYYRNEGAGWYYESATKRIFIEDGRVLVDDQSLKIYYFTTQIPENVIADLLVTAKISGCLNRAGALLTMQYIATGETIDKVFFEAGKSALDAITFICERCNYRFYFTFNGIPVFKPAPTAKASGSEDFSFCQCHIAGISENQDKSELWNRVVIEGLKEAQPIGKEEVMPSELRGEASDATSIDTYKEHTKTIKNHLFQTQTAIDTYKAIYLAAFKDPKWYDGWGTPYNPVPLELWDTVRWQIRLSPPSGYGKAYGTFKYGDGTKYGSNGIIIIRRGLIRDIKIDNFIATYKCEKI